MSSPAAAAAQRPAERYLALWASHLASVLGQMAGKSLTSSASTAASEAATGVDSRASLVVRHSGGRDGRFAGCAIFRLADADAVLLACQFSGEDPGEPGSRTLTDDSREALLELFRQAGGLVGSAIKPEFGEVWLEALFEPGAGPATQTPARTGSPEGSRVEFRILEGETVLAVLHGEADADLTQALTASATASLEPAPAKSSQSGPGKAAAASHAATALPSAPPNLGLLWDVHLGIVLRFGQKRMPLREILDFCAGTVIELDQQIEDPVELLLDGKVIARGEVVVVEGNYGLRVTEVAVAVSP